MSKLLHWVRRQLSRSYLPNRVWLVDLPRPLAGLLKAGRRPGRLPTVSDLILDVGAHRGNDTDFYLRKGFRVVAVEADPFLAQAITERFAGCVASGQLCVLPYGIHRRDGTFDFYQNLEADDWSSFKPEYGARDGTRHRVLKVRCIRFERVLRAFGVPHYLKIDIEGHDRHVLEALVRLKAAPKYLSVESHGIEYFAYLHVLGYDRFKIINQISVRDACCPFPAREGRYVDYRFDSLGHSSGLFGEESPGEWKCLEEVAYEFLHVKRGFPERGTLGTGWFDLHARRAD